MVHSLSTRACLNIYLGGFSAGSFKVREPDDHRPLDELGRKLDEVEARRVEKAEPVGRARATTRGMALGFRISIEMTAAIVVGAVLGYFIDKAVDTTPLFLGVFLFLGAAAGALNAYRAARGADNAVGFGRAMDSARRECERGREKSSDAPLD